MMDMAQGCEARATLGNDLEMETTPTGLCQIVRAASVSQPRWGCGENETPCSQGRRAAPTLGFGTMPRWGMNGSIPHIFFIPFDFVFAEQRPQLVLKIHLPVVFLLSGNVLLHLFQI